MAKARNRQYKVSRLMIIYLHGPTGSGKTSIAAELREILEPTFLHFAMDTVFEMLPRRILARIARGEDLSDLRFPPASAAAITTASNPWRHSATT